MHVGLPELHGQVLLLLGHVHPLLVLHLGSPAGNALQGDHILQGNISNTTLKINGNILARASLREAII